MKQQEEKFITLINDNFLISGAMCYGSCGYIIKDTVTDTIIEALKRQVLEYDLSLICQDLSINEMKPCIIYLFRKDDGQWQFTYKVNKHKVGPIGLDNIKGMVACVDELNKRFPVVINYKGFNTYDETDKELYQNIIKLITLYHNLPQTLLPEDANISLYNPQFPATGIVSVEVEVQSQRSDFKIEASTLRKAWREQLAKEFPANGHLKLLDSSALASNRELSTCKYYMNILVNLLGMGILLLLFFSQPGALAFFIVVTIITIFVTLLTAREYLKNFLRDNMSKLISLGIALAYGHILYQFLTFYFAVMLSFSMVFMTFMMPIMLILFLNIINLIKNNSENQSIKLLCRQNLLDCVSEKYDCYTVEDSKFDGGSEIKFHEIQAHIKKSACIVEGDYICVKPKECFPIDGQIVAGKTWVDTKVLNGESNQLKQKGDYISALAANIGNEPVYIKAGCDWSDSSAYKVLFRGNRNISQGQAGLVVENYSHDFSKKNWNYIFGAVVFLLFALVVALPFAIGIAPPIDLIMKNLMGVAFAICPCAIAIASTYPRVVAASRIDSYIFITNKANKKKLLNRAKRIDTYIFDKTGTLTNGDSFVYDVSPSVLKIFPEIVALEQKCGGDCHPIGKAIIKHARKEKLFRDRNIFNVESVSRDSRGVSGIINKDEIILGNAKFLEDNNVKLSKMCRVEISEREKQGLTCIYVARNKRLQGHIYIKHEIRSDSIATLLKLKEQGKKIFLLTGDTEISALSFNTQIGELFDVYALNLMCCKPAGQQKKSSIALYEEYGQYFGIITNSQGISVPIDIHSLSGAEEYKIEAFPWLENKNNLNVVFKGKTPFVNWLKSNFHHTLSEPDQIISGETPQGKEKFIAEKIKEYECHIYLMSNISEETLREAKGIRKILIKKSGDSYRIYFVDVQSNEYKFIKLNKKDHEELIKLLKPEKFLDQACKKIKIKKCAYEIAKLNKGYTQNHTICYVGDGSNDSLSMIEISENGGISIATSAEDKAAYFSDCALGNGTLSQLCNLPQLNEIENKITKEEDKIIKQNQAIIITYAFYMTAFIIVFALSNVGIAPVLMALLMFVSTTSVSCNSRRLNSVVDMLFNNKNLMNSFLAHNSFYGLILGGSMLALTSLLGQTIATGGLPIILVGTSLAIASTTCLFTGIGAVVFCLLLLTIAVYVHKTKQANKQRDIVSSNFKGSFFKSNNSQKMFPAQQTSTFTIK